MLRRTLTLLRFPIRRNLSTTASSAETVIVSKEQWDELLPYRNMKAYRNIRDELTKEHYGDWAVVQNEEVKVFSNTGIIEKMFENGKIRQPFYLTRIGMEDDPLLIKEVL